MQDNIIKLYNALKDTYDLGDENSFRTYLESGSNREALRKELETEWEVGDSASFARYLGFEDEPKVEPAKPTYNREVTLDEQGGKTSKVVKDEPKKIGSIPTIAETMENIPKFEPKAIFEKESTDIVGEDLNATNGKEKWIPTAEEKKKYDLEMQQMQGGVKQAKEKLDTRSEYVEGLLKNPFASGAQRIEIGNTESVFQRSNPRVIETDSTYNTETGKFEKSYLNEFSEYDNKALAEYDQKQADIERYKELHPDYKEQATRKQVANMDNFLDDELSLAQEESSKVMAEYIDNANFGALMALEGASMAGGANIAGGNIKLEYIPTEQAQELSQRINNLKTAKTYIRDANRIIAEADANAKEGTLKDWLESSFAGGAARGFGQKLFDIDTWDFGLTDLRNNTQLLLALDKADKGEELSDSQVAMLDAKAIELATNAYFGSYVGKGYKAGTVTAESIPFMLEMCINPASATGSTAANKLARYALKRFAKKAVGEAAEELTEYGLKKAAIGAVSKKALKKFIKPFAVTGRAVGDIAGSAGMASTTGALGVSADAVGRMAGDVTFDTDESGKTVFAGRDSKEEFGEAFAKAFVSRTIENYSEKVGEYFAPVIGLAGKVVGKGLDKVGLGIVNKAIKNIKASDWAKAVDDFESHASYSGTIGEFSEEIVGGILNAIFVGDQTLDTNKDTGVFNSDNLIDTYLGVALMGGVMSGIKTLGYKTPKYRARQNMIEQGDLGFSIFGNQEKWGQIRNAISFGSEEDVKAVLAEVKNDDSLTQEQKMQAFRYAQYAMHYRGILEAEQKRREEQAPLHTDLETSFDNGYSLEGQEMNDANNNLALQREAATNMIGEENVNAIDNNPIEGLRNMQASGSTELQMQTAIDYANAKATYDGMQQRVTDDIDGRVAESDRLIDERTSKADGSIHPVTLKGEKKAFIVDGSLSVMEDGSVDNENSDKSILIRDAETNEIRFVSPSDIVSADAVIDPVEEKRMASKAIREEVETKANAQMEGVLAFNVGDTYNVLGEDGAAHTVAIASVGQNGEVMASIDGGQPSVVDPATIQQQYNAFNVARLEEAEQQKQQQREAEKNANTTLHNAKYAEGAPTSYEEGAEIVIKDENGNEKQAIIAGRVSVQDGQFMEDPEGNIIEYTVDGEVAHDNIWDLNNKVVRHLTEESAGETDGEASPEQTGANEPSAATPQSDAMPMMGEEPDFMATTPERGHRYLYDEAGIPKAAADNMVTAHINAAEKEVKKQSDALAKLDANPGTSISAYKAKQADIKGKLDAAQAAYDYWNGVKSEQGKRDEAERQAAFAAQTADASGRQNELAAQKTPKEKIDAAKQMYGEYFDSDFTVPYDAMELVAMNMPNEKISWEGREGVRGLQQELGSNFKRGVGRDRGTNAFNIYLAKKGEGISTDEAIHSIYESAENTLPNGEYRWDVEEIRGAFIDMFMSAEKPSDIRDYVLNNRIRQAEQMRAAEDEAAEMARLDDEIMQRTGMEREEYGAWIAELEVRADAQAAYENEVYNETNTSNDRETEGSIGEEGSGQVQGQEGDTTGVEEDGAAGVAEGGRRNEGTQGDTTERQEGDLAQAKVTARLSSEVNEFDKPFVLASNGTTTFGEISNDSGLTEAPIKLSLGENKIDEEGGNHGYGLLHIEAGHGEQIRAAGFNSVEEFVETVAKNYDTIREGAIVANNQTYLLEISDEHNNTLFIQLSRDGKYWNVNSAGIFKKKYSRRKQEVYTRPALEPGTNTDSRGVDSGLSDGVTAPAGNSPETSASKGTENENTVQENEVEISSESENKEEGQNESTINGAVDMSTLLPVMSDKAFAELLESGDKEMMEAYLKEIEHALRLGDNAPLDGKKEVQRDYKKAVEQYGKDNIPEEVLDDLTKRIEPYNNLERTLFDRKYALEEKLRGVESAEHKASAEKKDKEKAAHKQTAYNGFLAGKTALGADAAEKALSKRINIEGEVMTVAEFVEKQHQSGSLVPSISEEPKYKGVSKRAWNRMDAAQQAAEEERVKNGGTKSVYRVNGYELGKTAYDYAQYLMKNNNDNVDDNNNVDNAETEKPQKSATKRSARASSVGKIDDFGEKIGGARKDLARGRIRDIKGYTTKDLTTLKKGADDILSQANILRLYKDGQMDEQTARGFLAMNNAVKVVIKKYGRTAREIILNKYRDAAVAWEEGRAAEFGITDADVAAYMAGFDITEEKARKDLDYCITETFDMYILTYQAMNYPAVERKLGQYVIVDYGSMRSGRIPLSRPFWVKTSYTSGRGYPFATLEGAMEKLNQLCPEVKPKDTEKKEKGEKAEHGLRVTKEGFGFYVKSRNIPGNIYLSPKFTSEKQTQAYMEENLEQLKAREQRLVDALMGSNIGMAEREGVDYRNGKDVTPQDFLDEFGFRGVEFGNWVTQGERQMYLNKTYDAIKDFCVIVGISPKAFSLGGRLGLAFGARGSGRALAHYEPGKEAINLTRMSGVGSLAHEWFHALDNILAKQETGNTSDMATMRNDVVREEVSAVLKEMYRVMKAMDYDMRSRRAGEYWGRTEEEFARLFENYIYNKLAEKEVTSPILVRQDILFDDAEEVSKNRWPYPSVAENATMAPLFDKLFSTIQEKTDEKGNVVLFQKLDGSTLSKEADATEMMMRDALIETMEGAGIEVVTDVAIGQQVLDENANATREMRVYHGSGADFDAFDHSHMGEGEGAQAYGWGTYVTEVEGIGKTYAQSVGQNPIGRRPVLYKGEAYDAVNTDGWSDEKKGVYDDLVQGMRVMGKSAEQAKDDLRLMTEVNIRNRERSLANLEGSSENYQSIAEDKRKQEERLKHINEFNADDFTREGSTPTLYTVEIPEENAAYYIGYNERMREQKEIVEMADNELAAQGWRRQEIGEQMVFTNSEGKRIVFTPNQTGADFYEEFVVALGSRKAASEFLSSVGITGIKYPAEFRSGGRTDGASNYVIFDERDLEITNKARLFRTSNGEVYGYTMGGKIYLDTRIATTETPIHEYSHLWSEALEQANPKAWEQLKNDLVKDTELMDYVKGLYPEIKDENELMHEVFAHFSGKRGRARLEEMRKEETEKANGLLDKARVIAMFHRLKELLGRYWTMARDLFAGSAKGLKKMKAEDFADMAMADLLGGFNPSAAAKNNDIRYQFVGEKSKTQEITEHINEIPKKYNLKGASIHQVISSREEMEGLRGILSDEAYTILEREYNTPNVKGVYLPEFALAIVFAEKAEGTKQGELTYIHEQVHAFYHSLPNDMRDRYGVACFDWLWRKAPEVYQKILRLYPASEQVRLNEACSFFIQELVNRLGIENFLTGTPLGDDFLCNFITEFKKYIRNEQKDREDLRVGRGVQDAETSRNGERLYNDNLVGRHYGSEGGRDGERGIAQGGKLYRQPAFYSNAERAVEGIKQEKATPEQWLAMIQKAGGLKAGEDKWMGLSDWLRQQGQPTTDNGQPKAKTLTKQEVLDFIRSNRVEVELPEVEEAGETMWAVDVTPEMRESVMEGQPMFREGGVLPTYEESLASSKAAGYTKKQHDAWWNRAHKNMRLRANEIAKKLHLEGIVDIYETADDLNGVEGITEEDKKSKGWYDPKTGRIAIILGNHASAHDVMLTMLHEGVAHFGLRKLFGKNFEAFLWNVYSNATPEVRNEINALMAKNGWNYETATEEYLGTLVEDTNFEQAQKNGFFYEVKRWFVNILRKLGFGRLVGGAISDGELRYILWRSYQNLSNPNEQRTLLGIAKDIAVQYGLGVGKFASSNAERLHRMDDGTREAYNKAVNQGGKFGLTFYNFREAFQDSMLALRKLQEVVENKYGVKLSDAENAYEAENQLSSKNDADRKFFKDKILEPMNVIVDRMLTDEKVKQEDLNDYLICKHGLERNVIMAERDARKEYDELVKAGQTPDLNALISKYRKKDYSGLKGVTKSAYTSAAEAAAKKIVDNFEAQHGASSAELWDAINKATKWTLSKAYSSGMMSRETYDKVRNMFQFYIPLRGWSEEMAEDVYNYIDSDYRQGTFNSTIKPAKGHEHKSDDPLATIGNMGDSAILQGNKNLMKQKMLNMATKYPTDVCSEGDVWLVKKGGKWVVSTPTIPANATDDQIAAAIEQHDADMQLLRQNGDAKRLKDNPDLDWEFEDKKRAEQHAVIAYVAGVPHMVYVHGNPRAAQAVNGLTGERPRGNKNDWTTKLSDLLTREIKSWYSSMVTSFNLNFSVPNFVRDLQHSIIMTYLSKGVKATGKLMANLPKAFWYCTKARLNKQGNSKMDKYFDEFLRGGGATGYAHLDSVDKWKKLNEKRWARLSALQKAKTAPTKILQACLEGIGWFSETLELVTRFNTYVTEREEGASVSQSVKAAKNITVNFNKKGSENTPGIFGAIAKVLRIYVAFFNPMVQGVNQVYEVIRSNKKAAARLSGICAYYSILGAVMPYVNMLLIDILVDDDDEKEKYNYFLQNEYTRRTNLMLFTGSGFAKVPLPQFFREFYGVGDAVATAMMGNANAEQTAESIVDIASNIFSIEGQSAYREWSAARFISPDWLDPVIDVENNENFMGSAIWNESIFNKEIPEYKKAKSRTWKPLVSIAENVNELQGGTEYVKGEGSNKWNSNPAAWQHIIEGYGGGVVRVILDAVNVATSMYNDEEIETSNIPIVNRFWTVPTEESANWARHRQYKAFEKYYDRAKAEHDGLKKDDSGVASRIKKMWDFEKKQPEAEAIYLAWNDLDIEGRLKDAEFDSKEYWDIIKEAVGAAKKIAIDGEKELFSDDEDVKRIIEGDGMDNLTTEEAEEILKRKYKDGGDGIRDIIEDWVAKDHGNGNDYYSGAKARETEHGERYYELRTYEDLVGDNALSRKIKDAEESGDAKLKRKLESKRNRMNEEKKKLAKPKADEAKIMEYIRRKRNEALSMTEAPKEDVEDEDEE